MYLKERHLKRLYHQATQAWRRGVVEGERTAPSASDADVPVPGDEAELIERTRPHERAVELAYRKGRECAGISGTWQMPVEVWSLVLAEAQRP